MRNTLIGCIAAGVFMAAGGPAGAIIYGEATYLAEASIRQGGALAEDSAESRSVLTADPASDPAPVRASAVGDPGSVEAWIASNGQFAHGGSLGRDGVSAPHSYETRTVIGVEGVVNDSHLPVSMRFGWLVEGGYMDLADSIGLTSVLRIDVESRIWDAGGSLIHQFEERTRVDLFESPSGIGSVLSARNVATITDPTGSYSPTDDDFEIAYRDGPPSSPLVDYDYALASPTPARFVEIPRQIKFYDYGAIPAGGSAAYSITVEMGMYAEAGDYTGGAAFAFADPLSASFGAGDRLVDPAFGPAAATVVPLPAAAPMLLSGAGLLFALGRRRR
jgi:hypothetical protein